MHNRVNALLQDNDGILCVKTDRGLNKCDYVHHRFNHIKDQNELLQNAFITSMARMQMIVYG